jgi:hypothetical protein
MYLGPVKTSLELTGKLGLLIEEWFENYDFVTFLNESHECTEHACEALVIFSIQRVWAPTFICSSRNSNLSLWIDFPP